MTGNDLIQKWQRFIEQYVKVSEQQSLVLALWCMHTWMYEQFHATPYLEIYATVKQSGKSTLLNVLSLLSRNPQYMATIMVKTVCRMVDAYGGQVSFFFDEAERLEKATLGDTRSMLATGYRKGGYHAVSVGKEFAKFPVYCPKAFALIGNLTDVLRDRSLPIQLERNRPAVDFHAHVSEAESQASDMIEEFMRFVKALGRDRVPVIAPEWLDGRNREIVTPLLSVAHLIGMSPTMMETFRGATMDLCVMKTWPRREYHSAQAELDAEDVAASERVLTDMKAIIHEGETVIPSSVAVERLRLIQTSPWRMWRETGLNEITLAALLSRYGLGPENVQIGKGRKDRKIVKGYKVAAIQAAK